MKEERRDKTREDRKKRREKTRRENEQDKRRDRMKKKREDEREKKMTEKMKRDRGEFFSQNVSRSSNPPDELAENVSKKKKKLRRTNYSSFFFLESSESDRVFNYLHDSNSIFRAGRINSGWVWARTVLPSTRGRDAAKELTLKKNITKEFTIVF